MLYSKKEKTVSIAFLIPSILAIGIFVYGFIIWTIVVSLSNWKSLRPDYSSVGFENFKNIFLNERFKIDIFNNLYFLVFFVVICLFGGLFLAILIDQKIKGENIFRAIFMYPLAISFVASGVIWKWIFTPSAGINLLLEKIGFENISWGWFAVKEEILNFRLALIPIIIAACWQYIGYIMVLYLAGIRCIPEQIREAARIDGASETNIYLRVVLPNLKPVTFGAVMILAQMSLRVFDLVVSMTGSGAGFITDFPAVFMYDTTFRANKFAQGATLSVIIFIMTALFIIPYLVFSLRKEK